MVGRRSDTCSTKTVSATQPTPSATRPESPSVTGTGGAYRSTSARPSANTTRSALRASVVGTKSQGASSSVNRETRTANSTPAWMTGMRNSGARRRVAMPPAAVTATITSRRGAEPAAVVEERDRARARRAGRRPRWRRSGRRSTGRVTREARAAGTARGVGSGGGRRRPGWRSSSASGGDARAGEGAPGVGEVGARVAQPDAPSGGGEQRRGAPGAGVARRRWRGWPRRRGRARGPARSRARAAAPRRPRSASCRGRRGRRRAGRRARATCRRRP